MSPIQEMYSMLVAYRFHNIANNDVLMCFFFTTVCTCTSHWGTLKSSGCEQKSKSSKEHVVLQSNVALLYMREICFLTSSKPCKA